MNNRAQINQFWQEKLANRADNWVTHVVKRHQARGQEVTRIKGEGHVTSKRRTSHDQEDVFYQLHVSFLVKDGNRFYQEEQTRAHQAHFVDKKIVSNSELTPPVINTGHDRDRTTIELTPVEDQVRFNYDRRAAVQYAERWWNDANPAYHFFEENDCTNYISQCLRAGGAPFRGYPNRSSGWWYQQNNWSFSWSVAHSFRWYLSGSTQGLRGYQVDSPEKLNLGDVICYDFQGDGRFDHNTIVVAFDEAGMPLVNAHTNNSRHRYWDYQDSMAWTPNCQYKFFRIGSSDML
ncbi:Putative amidase domain-containing protein [Amphibacillus marinus]|uniref:Putative amidase domain-containing protein n=1 Tax=Amphibacillus marinus TaxID=872970 RepID=A0A1H8R0C4_9BACI|nr:amidase domain-containing protein [Amphibacillus marinus]SEO60039.1 Putative amidase domain-containing protein [Amphibacillus marinus]